MAHGAAQLVKFARRKKMNLEVMYVWFGVLLTMMVGFIIFNLVRKIASRRGDGAERKPAEAGALRRALRTLRVMAIKKAPGLPSSGHALVTFVYLALDIVCSFVHMDNNNFPFLTNFASRNGWLAIGNLMFVILLAMKNTPLGFLSGWSYDRLNILHQIAGYATVVHVIIHGASYAVVFEQIGLLARFQEVKDACGIVAGLAFVFVAVAAIFIRPWYYELFYIIHVSFWMVAVVTFAIHQPDFATPFIYMTIVVAGLWILDRTVRFLRLMFYTANNSVSLTPLPHKGTLVTLLKAPIGAAPGQHCFLWIPKLRRFETHPFTITSVNPLQFVVASHDGFTQELHQYAIDHPGKPLNASVEGAYGSFPSPMKFDKVVLIAGGSGASFTFGLAKRILEHKTNVHASHSISLVWSVKQHSYLEWYATHLDDLKEDDRFNTHLYVTAQGKASQQVSLQAPDQAAAVETEKAAEKADESKVYVTNLGSASPSTESSGWDSEKSPTSPTESIRRFKDTCPSTYHGCPVNYRRPDVDELISSIVRSSSSSERVLVMACGPLGMTKQVRKTVTKCMTTDGPQVELHCEQFGW